MPPFSPQPRLRMPASYPPMDAQCHITPPVLPTPPVSSNYPVSTAAITALPSSIQSSFTSPYPSSHPLSSPLSSLPSSLSSSLPSAQFSSLPSSVPFTQFSTPPSSIQSSFGFSFSPTTPISSSSSPSLPSTFSTSLLSTQLSTLSSSLSSGQGQFSPVPSTNAAPSDSNPVGDGAGMEDNAKEFSEQAFPKSLLNDYYSDSSGSDDEREAPKPLQTQLGRRNESGEEVHLSLEASTATTQPAVSLNDSLPPPPSMFTSLLSPAKSEIVPQSSSALSSTVTPTTFTSITIPSTTVTSTTLTSTPSRLPNPRKLQPENIKITPSLTSVLSDIFPQLSKSLENKRKRKLEDGTGTNTQQLPSDLANSTELPTYVVKSPKVESVAMDAAASFEMGGASMGDNSQMGSTSSNLVPIPEAPPEMMSGTQMVEEKSIEPDQEMFNVPPQLMYPQERPPPHPNSFSGGRPPPGSPGFYPPGPARPPQGFFPYNNRSPFPPRARYPPPHMYPRQQFRPGFRGGPPPHNFRPRFH